MRELAKLANVSVSTVSKAFSEADDVSPETKEYIFSIAKQNGCFGKFHKKKYSKKTIAIITPEIISEYYSIYIDKLRQLIEKNNGIALISTYQFSVNKQEELIEYYSSYLNVDGIFIIGLNNKIKKGYDIPIVSIFSEKEIETDSVNVNLYPAILSAVGLLKGLNHKKIAFLGEDLTKSKEVQFLKAIKEFGEIEGITIKSGLRFEAAGKDCAQKLLEKHPDCRALICAYDNIAIGAIKELKNKGFRIPEDFSVIGIDNINISQHIETTLTTIDTSPDEICMIAWDLMSKKLKNKFYKSYQKIILTANLIKRESVAIKGD